MSDQYRYENLSKEDLQRAKEVMLNFRDPQTGDPLVPSRIDRLLFSEDSPQIFNAYPAKTREQFFVKTSATGSMNLGDIIRKRIESAPDEKPTDMRSIIVERMANIDKAEKEAVNKEQQILAAAVPQVDASGRVVSAPAAPAPKKSFIDYLKGTGETVAALGSQAVVAPVAAGAQLASDIQSNGAVPPVLPRPIPPKVKPRVSVEEYQTVQKIIKGQDPAGLPGVASVGAAGRQNPVAVQAAIDQLPFEMRGVASQLPLKDVNLKALESHVQALTLPNPIQLTKGQATGDLVALSNELNRRGELPNIAQRIGQQNNALIENLTSIRKEAAPDAYGTKASDFGQQVIDGYLNIDRQRNDNIRQLYGQLEQAAGGNFPIDAQKFVQSADQQLKKKLKSEFLPPEIDRQLQSYRDGSSMDFEQFESLRTNLATEIRKAERAGDGNKSFALGVVRDSLENLPLTGEAAKLKPLADAARKAAKERFDALKRDPAYSAAVDGKVAPENFIDTFVLSKGKGTEANVRQMMSALGKGTPEQQAVAAGLMDIISRKSIDRQGNFSQAAYNDILKELEPKLLEVFDPNSAKHLKNLGEVARKVMAQPKGSFANNSNTFVASLSKGVEQVFNLAAPGLSLGTQAVQSRQKKTAQKFELETLEPFAGAKQERTLGEILRGK